MSKEVVNLKRVFLFLIAIVLFTIIFLNYVYAGQPDRIREAQKAITAPTFDPSAGIGLSFSDSIDPSSGTLTVSIIDGSVPGRNGMNVVLKRTYSSNIFLNINKKKINLIPTQTTENGQTVYEYTPTELEGDYYCQGPDGNAYNTKVCPDCFPGFGWTMNGRKMDKCYIQYADATSWRQAKYLGRGWTLNYLEAKVEDPTPLLFGFFPASSKPGLGGVIGQYYTAYNGLNNKNEEVTVVSTQNTYGTGREYLPPTLYGYSQISSRGTSAISVGTDNGASSVILPSMYKRPNFFNVYDVKWGITTNYNSSKIYSNLNGYPTNELFQPNDTVINSIIKDKTTESSYVAFTPSLEPVTLSYEINQTAFAECEARAKESDKSECRDWIYAMNHQDECFFNCKDLFPIAKFITPTKVSYIQKSGQQYDYTHKVEYCGQFDDNKCNFNLETRQYTNWAENLYPGTYLSTITDQFGNQMKFDYANSSSPFLKKITAPGGLAAEFDYYCSNYDRNTRLYEIKYPTGGENNAYVQFQYDSNKPLLTKSQVVEEKSGSTRKTIVGSGYEFSYDSETQELTKVKLPTGATIEYVYSWMYAMPVIDYLQGSLTSGNYVNEFEQYFYQPKRVVVNKTIRNSAELCGNTGEGQFSLSDCTWLYQYKVMGTTNDMKDPNGKYLKTTIIDPWKRKTIIYTYPRSIAVTSFLNKQNYDIEWSESLKFLYPEDLSFRSGLAYKKEIYDENGKKIQEEKTDWETNYPFMNPEYVLGSSIKSSVGEKGELVGFVASVERRFPGENTDPLDQGGVNYQLALVPRAYSSEATNYPENYPTEPARVYSSMSKLDKYQNTIKNYNYGYVGINTICKRNVTLGKTDTQGYIKYSARNPNYPYDQYVNTQHPANINSAYTNLQGLDELYNCNEPNMDAIKQDTTINTINYLHTSFNPVSATSHPAYYGWTQIPVDTKTENAKGQLLSKTTLVYPDATTFFQSCGATDLATNKPVKTVPILSTSYLYTESLNDKKIKLEYDVCGNAKKVTAQSQYGDEFGNKKTISKSVETAYDSLTNFVKPTQIKTYDDSNPSLFLATGATYYKGFGIKTITNERGISTSYVYDKAGRLLSMSGPYDETPRVIYSYTNYSLLGATGGMMIKEETKLSSGQYRTTYYYHDGMGKMIESRTQTGSEVITNGQVFNINGLQERAYRATSRTGVVPTILDDHYYTYGCNGNSCPIMITKYDTLGRVKTITDTADPRSVITSEYHNGDNEQFTKVTDAEGQTAIQYSDTNGNLIKLEIPNGNIILL
jgi:hypothetical protein